VDTKERECLPDDEHIAEAVEATEEARQQRRQQILALTEELAERFEIECSYAAVRLCVPADFVAAAVSSTMAVRLIEREMRRRLGPKPHDAGKAGFNVAILHRAEQTPEISAERP